MRSVREWWRERRRRRVCEAAHQRMQEIVDGEVPDARERRVLESHLRECLPCGEEAGEFRELKAAIARVGTEPDHAVRERVAGFLEQVRRGELDGSDSVDD